MKEIRGEERRKFHIFSLVRMVCLTWTCRLPINQPGLYFSSSHPLHLILRSFCLFNVLLPLLSSPPPLPLFSLIFLLSVPLHLSVLILSWHIAVPSSSSSSTSSLSLTSTPRQTHPGSVCVCIRSTITASLSM